MVARRGGCALKAEHRPGGFLGQRGQPGIIAAEIITPPRLQHLGARPARALAAVAGKGRAAKAQGVAVGRDHLGQNRIVGPVRRQLTGGGANQELLHCDGARGAVILYQYLRIGVKAALGGRWCEDGRRCGGGLGDGIGAFDGRRGGLCQRQGGKRRGQRQQTEHNGPAECFFQGAGPPCNLERGVVQWEYPARLVPVYAAAAPCMK